MRSSEEACPLLGFYHIDADFFDFLQKCIYTPKKLSNLPNCFTNQCLKINTVNSLFSYCYLILHNSVWRCVEKMALSNIAVILLFFFAILPRVFEFEMAAMHARGKIANNSILVVEGIKM